MAVAFNDLQGLQSINRLGKKDRAEAIAQVARQFESFFVTQMLKQMRAANELLQVDAPFDSGEMQFREQMLDEQLGVSLSQGRGLGLAEVFARAMRQQFGIEEPSARPAADGVPGGLDARRIDRAPEAPAAPGPAAVDDAAPPPAIPALPIPAPAVPDAVDDGTATSAIPPVVRSAMAVIEPVYRRARREAAAIAERFGDKQDFVEALAPHAKAAAERLGVDHRVLIAQAALETGWGQSILGDSAGGSSFNLFNIKAGSYWKGPSVGVTTLEFRDGIPRPERARFRAYGSFAESFGDYAELLLGNGRYREALEKAGDAAGFVHGLARAGYATDPSYAAKILRLLRDPAIKGAP